ncbi:MAG: hypothetical protein ACRD0M_13460, partial [Acidimicrobiales bacterium]
MAVLDSRAPATPPTPQEEDDRLFRRAILITGALAVAGMLAFALWPRGGAGTPEPFDLATPATVAGTPEGAGVPTTTGVTATTVDPRDAAIAGYLAMDRVLKEALVAVDPEWPGLGQVLTGEALA